MDKKSFIHGKGRYHLIAGAMLVFAIAVKIQIINSFDGMRSDDLVDIIAGYFALGFLAPAFAGCVYGFLIEEAQRLFFKSQYSFIDIFWTGLGGALGMITYLIVMLFPVFVTNVIFWISVAGNVAGILYHVDLFMQRYKFYRTLRNKLISKFKK